MRDGRGIKRDERWRGDVGEETWERGKVGRVMGEERWEKRAGAQRGEMREEESREMREEEMREGR